MDKCRGEIENMLEGGYWKWSSEEGEKVKGDRGEHAVAEVSEGGEEDREKWKEGEASEGERKKIKGSGKR